MIYLSVDYKVISSGSSGNAVLIDDVLVDCGISFAKLKPYLGRVKYLLITHIHSDHVNAKALQRIQKLYPRITVIGNWEVAQCHKVDLIANTNYPIETIDYDFLPIEVPHDVTTYSYMWESRAGDKVFYCTDTYDLSNIPNGKKFDYFFLESNHDEKKVEAIRDESRKRFGYDAYSGAKRHLSTQQAKAFYYMRRRTKNAEWIELHKSSRFY